MQLTNMVMKSATVTGGKYKGRLANASAVQLITPSIVEPGMFIAGGLCQLCARYWISVFALSVPVVPR